MSWHAVDAAGMDLATGRPPLGPGCSSATAALAAAPVASWPVAVVAGDGRRVRLREALGPGGERVEALLQRLCEPPTGAIDAVAPLARYTPGGLVRLPVEIVPVAAGVEAAARVDTGWLARVGAARDAARGALVTAGRADELEAAVHLVALVATERLDPADDADVNAHVASGAQLWLLTGAVASALTATEPDPFAPWASLVACGWWPVGPCGGRLVVSATTARVP